MLQQLAASGKVGCQGRETGTNRVNTTKMPSADQSPDDFGATPLDIAVSSAERLQEEWTDHITNGLSLFLADFDDIELSPFEKDALDTARHHLDVAYKQITLLSQMITGRK